MDIKSIDKCFAQSRTFLSGKHVAMKKCGHLSALVYKVYMTFELPQTRNLISIPVVL